MNTLQLLYDEMKNRRKMICEATGCVDSLESYEQFKIECYARLLIADCMQTPYVMMSMVIKNKTVIYPYSKTVKIDDISVSEVVSTIKSWKEDFVSVYGKDDVEISIDQAIDYLIKSHEPKKFDLAEDYLNQQTDTVINEILRTSFEDGMSNDVTRKVESFANQNRDITCRWLVQMYEKTLENPAISEGLLRIIAMIYNECECFAIRL